MSSPAPAAPTRPLGRAHGARLVVQTWLGTRLMFAIVALAATWYFRLDLLQALGNWDVEHFVAIARYGYYQPIEMAFFPGLPAMLRAGMVLGLDPVVAGIVLCLITSALATWALYRLGGRWAAIAWLLAPTGVFTFVPYSESPFCAAAFWAWDFATRRRWLPAALCAAAACTLRVSGLFLIGALAVLAVWQWWTGRSGVLPTSPIPDAPAAGRASVASSAAAFSEAPRESSTLDAEGSVAAGLPTAPAASGLGGATKVAAGTERAGRPPLAELGRNLAWLLIPLLVLLAYATYLYGMTGSWTAWFSAQATGWRREFTWPWESLANHWRAVQPGMYADHPGWVWIFRAELVSMIVGVLVVLITLAKRRLPEAAWVGVQVLAFSLSYWFQSVCRAVLLWFPLWTLTGEFVERHRTGGWRFVWAGVVILAVVVQVAWAMLFYLGMWSS